MADLLTRPMPPCVEPGLNWGHVWDVALGHILAAEKGRIGERYILGNAEGNWTMAEAFEVLHEITGLPAPRVRIPYFVALMAAYANEALASVTGKPPKAPLAGVRVAQYQMFFNPGKAIRELGFPPNDAPQ